MLAFRIQLAIYGLTDFLGHLTLLMTLALDQQEWKLVCKHCNPRISDLNWRKPLHCGLSLSQMSATLLSGK